MIHKRLEGDGLVDETEGHVMEFIVPRSGTESGLIFVGRLNADLMVTRH